MAKSAGIFRHYEKVREMRQEVSGAISPVATTVLTDEVLLELLRQHPDGLTPAELQVETSISHRRAQERLKDLYEQGIITRVKEERSYRYMSKIVGKK